MPKKFRGLRMHFNARKGVRDFEKLLGIIFGYYFVSDTNGEHLRCAKAIRRLFSQPKSFVQNNSIISSILFSEARPERFEIRKESPQLHIEFFDGSILQFFHFETGGMQAEFRFSDDFISVDVLTIIYSAFLAGVMYTDAGVYVQDEESLQIWKTDMLNSMAKDFARMRLLGCLIESRPEFGQLLRMFPNYC